MKRRELLLCLVGTSCLPSALRAQTGRQPRIGYLVLSPVTDPPSRERQAFLEGLREHGLVVGKTVEIIYRSAEGATEFIDEVAQDLLKSSPDLIAVSGAPAVLAAMRATRSIPIVMLAVGDPVGIGAVPSLARPGGNLTGVSFISSDLAPKRLQLCMECVPGVKRVAIVWNRDNPNSVVEARVVLTAAKALKLASESLGMASGAELARSLDRLATRKPDLLYVAFEGGLAGANRTALAEFGLRERIPLVSGWESLTEAGGLLSYAPDIPAMFHRAAYHVDRVLKGAQPAQLPIELPTKVNLVINQRTARAIGVRVPRALLLRADRVIE